MSRTLRFVVMSIAALVTSRAPASMNVLMITTNNGSMTSSESTLKTRMESVGFVVSTIWDGDSQANFNTAFANNDMVYVPSSATASDVSNKLRTAQIGVVNELAALMDELGLCSSNGTTTTASALTIATNSHYITSPFPTGAFTLGSTSYTISRAAGTTASGATVLATVGGVNSVLAVNTGGTLANTVGGSNIAQGRRVQMPVECGVADVSTMTANALLLLQRIGLWAAGFEGGFEAHWRLNETSGASAADSSGNGRTGTVSGASSWVPAVLNNGFSFNGSTLIQSAGLMGSPRNVSVAAWANLTTADSAGAEILSLGDHFQLRLDEAGVTKAQFHNGSAYVSVDLSTTYAGTGWHHFAAVFDDPHNTLKLYVDGELAATLTTTSSISYAGLGSNTIIGRHGNAGTTRDFTGTIDDVRIYGYKLDAVDVARLYGLIGHWKLNQTSGTSATDSSPFARNGTVAGTAAWSSDCGGMGVFNFDGSTNYVSIPNHADFQPTGMISICAWIKGDVWSAGSDVDTVLRKGDASPNNYALEIADGRVEFLLDHTEGAGIRGTSVLSTGQWYHVAATWDGATAKVYVNGVLDNSPGTAKATPIGSDARPLYIGGRSGGDCFDGMIRDVRLYNRPLTATELAKLVGVVGHWRFAEGAGTTAADSSGAATAATLTGGASWTSDCTGNNNALLTNGTGGIAQTVASVRPPDVGTVAFWMRSTGTPAGTARILGLGADWEIRQINDGRVISDLCGDGSTTIGTVTPLTEVGRWYHFAATFDSAYDTYAIYVNGELEQSGTNGAAMSQQPAGVLSFGTRTGSTEYWSGALRDVRIYNRKLCPTEIAELHGLIGHWKFDETSGSTAADSSGQGRNGSVIGSATWTTGKIDNAIGLNGTNRVEVNSLLGRPKNITLAGWANLTSADSNGAELVGIGDYIAIRLNNGSTTRAFFYNGSSWVSASTSQMFHGAGWHHFAAVFNDDANTFKFYIDGVEAASVSTSVTIPYGALGTKTVIGAHGNGQTTYDFNGKIDDVRVYNRALCPTEIGELGSGGFGGVKLIKWVEIQ